MVIAALVCFAILLVAWALAPDPRPDPPVVSEPIFELDPQSLAA